MWDAGVRGDDRSGLGFGLVGPVEFSQAASSSAGRQKISRRRIAMPLDGGVQRDLKVLQHPVERNPPLDLLPLTSVVELGD